MRPSMEKKAILNDNKLIEKEIGEDTGCICLEDLVHEIYNVTPNFDKINTFLIPFRLNLPREFDQCQKTFHTGGDNGNRGDAINQLVLQMI